MWGVGGASFFSGNTIISIIFISVGNLEKYCNDSRMDNISDLIALPPALHTLSALLVKN